MKNNKIELSAQNLSAGYVKADGADARTSSAVTNRARRN